MARHLMHTDYHSFPVGGPKEVEFNIDDTKVLAPVFSVFFGLSIRKLIFEFHDSGIF